MKQRSGLLPYIAVCPVLVIWFAAVDYIDCKKRGGVLVRSVPWLECVSPMNKPSFPPK